MLGSSHAVPPPSALVGARALHADPSPATIPPYSIAWDFFGFGLSLLHLLTQGTWASSLLHAPHHTPPCPSLPARDWALLEHSLPSTCPKTLLFKMRPLAATITLSLQEGNFLPQNKIIRELSHSYFQWISLLWALNGACRLQPKNPHWTQEGSFRIRAILFIAFSHFTKKCPRDLTSPGLHLSKLFLQQAKKPPHVPWGTTHHLVWAKEVTDNREGTKLRKTRRSHKYSVLGYVLPVGLHICFIVVWQVKWTHTL